MGGARKTRIRPLRERPRDAVAIRHLLETAGQLLETSLVLTGEQFKTMALQPLSAAATCIASALLRLEGIAITSDADPHAELCAHLARMPGQKRTHQLMVSIGRIDIAGANGPLVRRAIEFMRGALVRFDEAVPAVVFHDLHAKLRSVHRRVPST